MIPFLIDKQKLYELAEWLITGMVLVFGFKYLKQITVYVLMSLYRLFIQKSAMPIV